MNRAVWLVHGRVSDHGGMRVRTVAVLLLIVIVMTMVVAVSPTVLRQVGEATHSWERLSFIGQTYGAASALIALLALVGVVVTLVFQARESRRAVEETRRQAMSHLLGMAMRDPDLDACWGPIPVGDDARARKQQLYTNMIVTQWATAFESGALPEARLRAVAREMFESHVGRTYWARARTMDSMSGGNRREQRFLQILDDAYDDAAPTSPMPAVEAAKSNGRPVRTPTGLIVGAGVVVAGAAVLVSWLIRCQRPRCGRPGHTGPSTRSR